MQSFHLKSVSNQLSGIRKMVGGILKTKFHANTRCLVKFHLDEKSV